MAERIRGVEAVARTIGEPMDIEILACGASLDSATTAMAQRFEQAAPPKAVFALFIQATLAVLREVAKLNLRIPEDISIAGFDDFEWMQVMHPPVATVVQPIEELAARAWQQLLRRIENPDGKAEAIQIPCSLEFRGSIAPPAKEDTRIRG